MKKTFYLFSLLFLLSLLACTKKEKIKPVNLDEDNGKPHIENIIGKWNITEFILIGDYVHNGTPIDVYGKSLDNSNPNYIVFNIDKTFESSSEPIIMKFTYKAPFVREVEEERIINNNLPNEGFWRIIEDSVFILNESKEDGYRINTLNSKRLRITSSNVPLDDGVFSMIATFERSNN